MEIICSKGNNVGKQRKRVRTCDRDDYISNMPEVILLHILSFLPLKEWIVVSVLSRRWKYLWTKISFLNLDQLEIIRNTVQNLRRCPLCGNTAWRECPYQCLDHIIHAAKMGFLEFVDRIVRLHSGCIIENLRLSFCYDPNNVSTERIGRWVHFCMTTNIKELELNFCDVKVTKFFNDQGLVVRPLGSVQQYDLTHGCFAPKMLKTLLLTFCMLKASCFGDFGSLQKLYLKHVRISDCLIGELVSKCPVLEDLTLEMCIIPKEFFVSKENIMIKRLSVMDCVVCELTMFRVDLSTPHLLMLMLVGIHIGEANIRNATHLVDAVINIRQGLLSGLKHCQTLTIITSSIEVILQRENLRNQIPILLENLRHLTLVVALAKQELPRISRLLRSCPNIESLTLDMQNPVDVYTNVNDFQYSYYFQENNYWESQSLPFRCLQNCLKKITINGIVGRSNEVKTVRFLLQNALVLENMVISIGTVTKVTRYQENLDQFLETARATTQAEIEILNDRNLNNV